MYFYFAFVSYLYSLLINIVYIFILLFECLYNLKALTCFICILLSFLIFWKGLKSLNVVRTILLIIYVCCLCVAFTITISFSLDGVLVLCHKFMCFTIQTIEDKSAKLLSSMFIWISCRSGIYILKILILVFHVCVNHTCD